MQLFRDMSEPDSTDITQYPGYNKLSGDEQKKVAETYTNVYNNNQGRLGYKIAQGIAYETAKKMCESFAGKSLSDSDLGGVASKKAWKATEVARHSQSQKDHLRAAGLHGAAAGLLAGAKAKEHRGQAGVHASIAASNRKYQNEGQDPAPGLIADEGDAVDEAQAQGGPATGKYTCSNCGFSKRGTPMSMQGKRCPKCNAYSWKRPQFRKELVRHATYESEDGLVSAANPEEDGAARQLRLNHDKMCTGCGAIHPLDVVCYNGRTHSEAPNMGIGMTSGMGSGDILKQNHMTTGASLGMNVEETDPMISAAASYLTNRAKVSGLMESLQEDVLPSTGAGEIQKVNLAMKCPNCGAMRNDGKCACTSGDCSCNCAPGKCNCTSGVCKCDTGKCVGAGDILKKNHENKGASLGLGVKEEEVNEETTKGHDGKGHPDITKHGYKKKTNRPNGIDDSSGMTWYLHPKGGSIMVGPGTASNQRWSHEGKGGYKESFRAGTGMKSLAKHLNKYHGVKEDEIQEDELGEKYYGFNKLSAKVGSPALAAWIGRKKYGKEGFSTHKHKGEVAEETTVTESELQEALDVLWEENFYPAQPMEEHCGHCGHPKSYHDVDEGGGCATCQECEKFATEAEVDEGEKKKNQICFCGHEFGGHNKGGCKVCKHEGVVTGGRAAHQFKKNDYQERFEAEYAEIFAAQQGKINTTLANAAMNWLPEELELAEGKGYDDIGPGDHVKFNHPLRGSDKVPQQGKGKVVMKGPAGWVVNTGGKYGTPGIVSRDNYVSHRKTKSIKAQNSLKGTFAEEETPKAEAPKPPKKKKKVSWASMKHQAMLDMGLKCYRDSSGRRQYEAEELPEEEVNEETTKGHDGKGHPDITKHGYKKKTNRPNGIDDSSGMTWYLHPKGGSIMVGPGTASNQRWSHEGKGGYKESFRAGTGMKSLAKHLNKYHGVKEEEIGEASDPWADVRDPKIDYYDERHPGSTKLTDRAWRANQDAIRKMATKLQKQRDGVKEAEEPKGTEAAYDLSKVYPGHTPEDKPAYTAGGDWGVKEAEKHPKGCVCRDCRDASYMKSRNRQMGQVNKKPKDKEPMKVWAKTEEVDPLLAASLGYINQQISNAGGETKKEK